MMVKCVELEREMILMDLQNLFDRARDKKASDIHLIVSSPPMLRIDGGLEPMPDVPAFSIEDLTRVFDEFTTSEQKEIFNREFELDFAHTMPEGWRIRCNAYRQQGCISMAIRLLPPTIPSLDVLGLPAVCKELIVKPRGLIIVTGPTGSGKSTTLASMIQYLNNTERRHVVTIEDPIEYIYPNVKCVVSQRQLSRDTSSFATALKHVLRQDPDVILVGEMRDWETAAAVITVAETGHLVLSTGHAPGAPQSIERIVDLFPDHERLLVQARLGSLLLGVLCQALVPRIGGGRVPAVEIMLANTAIKNLIREGKNHLLLNTIRTQSQAGMITLNQALVTLYKKGMISWDNVLAFCQDTEDVEKIAGRTAHK
jgi:twitching motility protein PilT